MAWRFKSLSRRTDIVEAVIATHHAMNRMLLPLVPDKWASTLLLLLAFLSFLLGVLDILTRDLDAAQTHLSVSLGIPAGLFVLKYLTLSATYRVAEEAQQRLHRHMQGSRVIDPQLSPEQAKAMERAQMAELAHDLRQALAKIPEDSPVRPKYEATIGYIERALSRA